ncbi:MAG: lytic transglycosylase domain-containing protein, partial [Alphaproteobacteria bacterium]
MRLRLAATLLAVVLGLGPIPATAYAPPVLTAPESEYRAVVAMIEADDYVNARFAARSLGDPLLERYVRWVEMSRPDTAVWFEDAVAFMREAPDWPRLATIRRNAEAAMGPDLPPDYVRDYFAAMPPLGGRGRLRHADALAAGGDRDGALAIVRDAWRSDTLDAALEAEILGRYGDWISRDDHLARLDRLLWERQAAAARRQAARLDRRWQLLADARIKLFQREAGVDTAIRAVPDDLQSDPGLLFDRARWRRLAGQFSGVVEILETTPSVGGDGDEWWLVRRWAVQQALADNNPRLAYRLAANHGRTEGRGFREGEWFAGWIALRQLDDAAQAFRHFERFHAGVETPVSKSRGAYWAGRAAEKAGDAGAAARWFAAAAADATTFYGQVAAGRIGAALLP